MDNSTEQLADGVWRVEVGFMINAFVIAADGRGAGGGLTLVDTGTTRSGPRFVRSVRLLGFEPTSIRDIVLTHWHADHTGSAARFAESSAAPSVHIGEGDLGVVTGRERPPKVGANPGDCTRMGRLLAKAVPPGKPVAAAQPLVDGQVLPGDADATIVAAPGHTPGHIAVHLPSHGVLIAGDAVMNLGRLTRGFAALRTAMTHEADTLARLAALEFDVLAVGHGPPVFTKARQRLAHLAARAAR